MTQPMISVIITTLNRPTSVLKAIHSVFKQTYSDYDLHIIDDGSVDNTKECVEKLIAGHANTSYWRHDRQQGLCAARNTGIRKSVGKLVTFLDDDDELKPDSLEKRLAAFNRLNENEKIKIGVVYCGCEVQILHEKRVTYNIPKLKGNIAKSIITTGLSTIPSSGIYPRQALEKVGGFDEQLLSFVDHDIWMSLAVSGYSALCIQEPLIVTYNHSQKISMVSDTTQRIKSIEQYLKKWNSTYKKWFGNTKANEYIINYRTNVLGALAAKKASNGEFRESSKLIKHLLISNKCSIKQTFRLSLIMTKALIRKLIPTTVLRVILDD